MQNNWHNAWRFCPKLLNCSHWGYNSLFSFDANCLIVLISAATACSHWGGNSLVLLGWQQFILIRAATVYSHWDDNSLFSLDRQQLILIGAATAYSHWGGNSLISLGGNSLFSLGRQQLILIGAVTAYSYWRASNLFSILCASTACISLAGLSPQGQRSLSQYTCQDAIGRGRTKTYWSTLQYSREQEIDRVLWIQGN